jgi:hypothetical protein
VTVQEKESLKMEIANDAPEQRIKNFGKFFYSDEFKW